MIDGYSSVLKRIQDLRTKFGLSGMDRNANVNTNEKNFQVNLDDEMEYQSRSVNGTLKNDFAGISLDDHIKAVALKYDVPEPLIRGIIKVESDFDEKVVSKKGAKGLMQLMDATSRYMGVKNPFNPFENIEGGVKYFSSLLRQFDGNLIKALAAYNAGPALVERSGIPEYKETNNYIEKVLKYYRIYS